MPQFETFEEFHLAAREYIAKDLHRRGETVVPKSVYRMAALIFMKVKTPDRQRAKKVVYSGAANILPGYRELFKEDDQSEKTE